MGGGGDGGWGGGSCAHRPRVLSTVLPGNKVADTILLLRIGGPPLAGQALFWPCPLSPGLRHTLGAELVGSPAWGQEQRLVRTWSEGHREGSLSFSEYLQDFF